MYAEEIGGEGPHRYVLMCLVALEDPGLTVFPTHRLLRDLRPDQHETLANAIRRDFDVRRLDSTDELVPAYGQPVSLGYIDAHFRQPWMLTLKDQSIADAALADHAEPYRRLDTAVLEALILKGALGMTDDDIDHLAGLDYARDFDQALELVQDGDCDAAFFVAATPIERGACRRRRRREHAAQVDVLLPEGPDRAAVQPVVRIARTALGRPAKPPLG